MRESHRRCFPSFCNRSLWLPVTHLPLFFGGFGWGHGPLSVHYHPFFYLGHEHPPPERSLLALSASLSSPGIWARVLCYLPSCFLLSVGGASFSLCFSTSYLREKKSELVFSLPGQCSIQKQYSCRIHAYFIILSMFDYCNQCNGV